MQAVNVMVADEQKADLVGLASVKGISQAEVIRRAIDEYVRREYGRISRLEKAKEG